MTIRTHVVLGFVLLAFSPSLFHRAAIAQVATDSGISGIVTDPSGSPIPGASVSARNQATGGIWNATTNQGGSYSFAVLPPGTYTVTVTHQGFQTVAVSDRTISVAEPAHVDLRLSLGSVTDTITVSAQGNELINTATAEIATTITPSLVTGTPLVRGNFLDLAVMAPGVVPQDVAQGVQISNGSAQLNYVSAGNVFVTNNIFVAGARDTATNISLDGSNIQNSLFGEVLQSQSTDTVAEMRVESANMSAEFGNGVAAMNVITKSGSNQIHGDAYEFLRNNKLDASPFFTNLAGSHLPTSQQNRFGTSVGGPVKKNRLFLFGNYEGLRVRQANIAQETPPPLPLRTGDFSSYHSTGTTGPIPTIYNPFSYSTATGLRTPFPNNQIPLSLMDPAALAYVQKWVVQPNATVDGIPRLVGNTSSVIDSNQFTLRADWLKTEKTLIYGRYTQTPLNAYSNGLMPLEGAQTPYRSRNAVTHWTQTLSPNVINDAMIAYTRMIYYRARNLNVPDVSAQIGVKNVDPSYGGGPAIGGTGFDMGISANQVRTSTTDTYQFKDGLSVSHGRHNLKFGVEINQRRLFYVTSLNDKGGFTFENTFTRACPAGNNPCESARGTTGLDEGGLAFADYLLGAFTSSTLTIFAANYRGINNYVAGYAQDSWRVTPKLTVNYGLRYEYFSPWIIPRNTAAGFNFQTAQLVYTLQNPLDYLDASKCYGRCAPLNDAASRAGYTRGERNFAPRLGAGYLLTPTTVLRASTGIYFDGNFNENQMSNLQYGAPPFSLLYNSVYSPNTQAPTEFMHDDFPAASATAIPQPNSNPPTSFRIPENQYKVATMYQWSFSVQQKLGSSWGLELNYLGEKTIRELQFIDENAPALPQGPLANLTLQQRRRYPQWGSIAAWAPLGWGKYEGLVARIKNNEWHGLTLLGNYTFAKNLVSSNWGSSDQGNQNFRTPYIWAGPYASTPRHRVVAGYSYRLPFGHGKAIGNGVSPVLNAFIAGWNVSGISTFSSGSPNWVNGLDLSGTGLTPALPDRVCDAMQNAPRTRFQWFNTSCFVQPAFGTYGNSTLGSINIPGTNNWNLAFSKFTKTNFPRESGELELRVEMINAFNHTQWGAPDINMTNRTYGTISSTRPPRQIQVAMRYRF